MSDINTLRDMLFDTARALTNKENPIELDRAKAMCDVAQAIINSAKVEVDFMKATGARVASGFIAVEPPKNTGRKPGYTYRDLPTTTPQTASSVPPKPLTGTI